VDSDRIGRSMSVGLSDMTSQARKPAPYATLNAGLYLSPGAASGKRETSSTLRATGSFRGLFERQLRMCFVRYQTSVCAYCASVRERSPASTHRGPSRGAQYRIVDRVVQRRFIVSELRHTRTQS
jgi:hypothetical protein